MNDNYEKKGVYQTLEMIREQFKTSSIEYIAIDKGLF